MVDRYTKVILTIIAISLSVNATGIILQKIVPEALAGRNNVWVMNDELWVYCTNC